MMKRNLLRHSQIVAMFTMIPVVFNALIWLNYPISAECLLPEFMRGSVVSLLAVGLAFGLFTAIAANFCLFFALSLGKVLKNQTINRHFDRHRNLYAALWVVSFTFAGFAGFLSMICFRDPHAATSDVFIAGMQGFLTAALLATVPALLFASACAALRDRMLPAKVIEPSGHRESGV
jgi:hypothetical protein